MFSRLAAHLIGELVNETAAKQVWITLGSTQLIEAKPEKLKGQVFAATNKDYR